MESKNEIAPVNDQNILNDNGVEVDYWKWQKKKLSGYHYSQAMQIVLK